MTAQGVFRDDYYNAMDVLAKGQYNTTAQASGTISASVMSGAVESYLLSSGATALTTDTAANLIANMQTAVAAAQKAAISGFGAGVSPPPGVPNLFNVSWVFYLKNTNAGTLTVSAGTGVTLTGTTTLATATVRQFLLTVTSPTTVTMQDLGGFAFV
jgi:hypothetical protein